MERENEIRIELETLGSPLAGLSRSLPFAIPQGYFEESEHTVIAGVMAAESEDLALQMPRTLPYSVPPHYFEESYAQIMATALLPASAAQAFDVPEGYFEALPDRIMASVKAKEEPALKPRIIAFRPARRVLQWAVAAILVLGMGLGSYSIYYTPDKRVERQLAKVDGDAISDYVVQNDETAPEANTVALNTPTASAVKALSKEDITNYLDETGWEDAATAE